MAAIDTGLKGIGSAVDAELFVGKATEAVIYQMRANRATQRAAILAKLNTSIETYPLEAATHDMAVYFNEGSVAAALSSLTAAAASRAASATSDAASAARAVSPPASGLRQGH